MSRRHVVIIGVLLLASGELHAQATSTDSAAVAREVESQMDRWLESYERRDPGMLAQLFTESGIYAANTGEVLRGREGIETGVAAWFAANPGAEVDLHRTQIRFRITGRTAHDLSRFTIHAVGPRCVIDAGHALSVWRQDSDGAWRIETLLVNQDRAMPEGACPRPPAE